MEISWESALTKGLGELFLQDPLPPMALIKIKILLRDWVGLEMRIVLDREKSGSPGSALDKLSPVRRMTQMKSRRTSGVV